MKEMLSTHELAVGYGKMALIKDIGIAIRQGEVVGLIGVNGGGKSTLLRTLTGALEPVSGAIQLDGRPQTDISANQRARLLSVVLTERPRLGLLDVRTLITLGRQPWTGHLGRTSTADENVIDLAMERTDTARFAKRSLDSLSDGEVQRVMIARALAQDTPLIILDEPTAFLDLVNRVGVVQLLRDLARSEGKGILFSTHDLQTALDLCDRLFVITGPSIWTGTTEEARNGGVLERTFVVEGMRFDPGSGGFRKQ